MQNVPWPPTVDGLGSIERQCPDILGLFFKTLLSQKDSHNVIGERVERLVDSFMVDESVDLCVDLLFADCDTLEYKDCKFNRTQFRKLLSFAVKDTHFVFNGQLFDQIDGVAMRSPLGPSLANIFMCMLVGIRTSKYRYYKRQMQKNENFS